MVNQYTKEGIKTRMYKQAASLWDIRNIENLGPVVKLLIESLAAEIFKLSGDMYTIESRLLEKVASVLTPHTALTAQPAHGIATALPCAGEALLLPMDTFSYKNALLARKYKLKSLSFTPLYEARVMSAELNYLATGDEFCFITSEGERNPVARMAGKNPVANRSVWLGVKFGSSLTEIGECPLYIDLPNLSDVNSYLQLLPHCTCTLAGTPVEIKGGIDYRQPENVTDKYDINQLITSEIIHKYDSHFITLMASGMNPRTLPRAKVPEEFETLLPADFIAGLEANTIWIKITFPTLFSEEVLSRINIHINAFVVVNKYPARVSRKVDQVSTVIPLKKNTMEYFLSVGSVVDSHGKYLHEITALPEESASGCYSVRKGGCERFNTMDAKDYLNRLTDLLYDESMAFASNDKDGVREDIEQIEEQIARLEQRNGENAEGLEMTSYVITDKLREDNTLLTVNYFLTNGEFANDIHAGDPLGSCSNPDINRTSVKLVTPTKGGSPSPSVKRRMDMYRFMLLSQGRIYSKEDIRNCCMAKFGDYLTSVEVQLGYQVGTRQEEGFVRTLDVHLNMSERAKGLDTEALATDIYSELKSLSPETYNYRIRVNK